MAMITRGFENSGTALTLAPLDEELFARMSHMEPYGSEVYGQLLLPSDVLDDERQKFEASNQTYTPNLQVQTLDDSKLEVREEQLVSLKEAAQDASNDVVGEAYRLVANEKLAKLRMLRASHDGDMHRFEGYNRFIYGEPDFQLTAAVADWFSHFAAIAGMIKGGAVQKAAEEAIHKLEVSKADYRALYPDTETFQTVRADHFAEGGFFERLLQGIDLDPNQKVTRDIGHAAVQRALVNLGSEYSVGQANSTVWSVSHAQQQVKEPAKYNLPYERFIGLPLGHEIGSHLLEYVNGRNSGLLLASRGLDRVEAGNEGRAVVREQVPYKEFADFAATLRWADIMRRQLAVALGAGFGGGNRTFNEVYEVINAIDRVWERYKLPDDVETADRKADTRSWNLLATRILKGTDGQGGAYFKDKAYLEGNVRVWATETEKPGTIALGDYGKFDVTNPRHLTIMQAIGVTL